MKEVVMKKSLLDEFKNLCIQSGIDYKSFYDETEDSEIAVDNYLNFLSELVTVSLKYGAQLYRNEIECIND